MELFPGQRPFGQYLETYITERNCTKSRYIKQMHKTTVYWNYLRCHSGRFVIVHLFGFEIMTDSRKKMCWIKIENRRKYQRHPGGRMPSWQGGNGTDIEIIKCQHLSDDHFVHHYIFKTVKSLKRCNYKIQSVSRSVQRWHGGSVQFHPLGLTRVHDLMSTAGEVVLLASGVQTEATHQWNSKHVTRYDPTIVLRGTLTIRGPELNSRG